MVCLQLALQLLFKATVREAGRREALIEEAEKRSKLYAALPAWSPSRGLTAAAAALGVADWQRRLHVEPQRLSDLFKYALFTLRMNHVAATRA